jgi:hypothetical protein
LRAARDLLRPALGRNYIESRGIGWNLNHRSRGIESLFLPEVERERAMVETHGLQVPEVGNRPRVLLRRTRSAK